MPRNLDIALEDILTAIARIEETVDGVDFVQFSSDWRTRYIIERCLQIISEASRSIPDDLQLDRF
jgi:uncharacterized protein with HEPN domain